jgi:flavin-dependent dehydrogenase
MDCDILIIGAGPAGLCLAKELCNDFKVIIIERKKLGQSNAIWSSWKDVVEENGLEDCIINKYNELLGKTYLGARVTIKFDYYCILDGKKVLKKWIMQSKKANFLENCEYQNFAPINGGVEVRTSKGKFTCKLLIDASGPDSTIVNAFRLVKDELYWVVYGEQYKNLRKVNPNSGVYCEILIQGIPRPNFEIFPISKTKAIVLSFYFSRKKEGVTLAKEYLSKYVNSIEYKEIFKKRKREKVFQGYIPLYDLKSQALDRVLIVGDAAGWAPKFNATGFNFILTHHKKVAEKIKGFMNENKLDAKTLNNALELNEYEKDVRNFQKLGSYLMSNFDDLQVDRYFRAFSKINQKVMNHLVQSKRDAIELFQTMMEIRKEFPLSELAKALPKEKYISIAKIYAKIFEDFVIEEALHLLKH